MSRHQDRPRYTVTLSVLPGAEPWVRVEHSLGWFKLPAYVALAEVLEGVRDHWVDGHAKRTSGELYVRVPLREWRELTQRPPCAGPGS